MVIDSNEWLSGIDIPKVMYANCYYNEMEGVRTSVYRLDIPENSLIQYVQRYSFEIVTSPALQDEDILTEVEKLPKEGMFYRATGQKESDEWQYIVDAASGMLWVENRYQKRK